MFNVLKRLIPFLVFIFLLCFSINVEAKSNCYFVWEKTTIEVPYKANVYDYKDDYIVKFYVNGIESQEFDVYREVNGTTLSTVVTTRLGKYIVYYKAFSIEHNISSTVAITFLVVDVNKPTVTLTKNKVELEFGKTLEDVSFFTITDDIYSLNDLDVKINSDMINYSVLGVYPASITVTDGYGNSTTKAFEVEIIDTTPPVITILQPLIFEAGDEINYSKYFMIIDSYNGDVTKFIEVKNLDINKVGRQQIIVSCKDYSNNSVSLSYHVDVVDEKAPLISLSTYEIELDISNFSSYNADFFQNYISKITDNCKEILVEIDCSSLRKKVEDFIVTYTAKDVYGNSSKTNLIVKLRELNGPILICEEKITIKKGEALDLLSLVSVYDEYDINAADTLVVEKNGFDNEKIGTYYVKYSCYNNSGRFTEKTIQIVVDDEVLPEVIINFIKSNKKSILFGIGLFGCVLAFIIKRKRKKNNTSSV